ncbi:uncharacterized protein N7483_000604 [Penicillium malachiteum]|uniref:uncharacterized protein n=1 Tax=Penicillium malachiteum TaxID=1324776 RepID=UPI0025469292|nr:uncharacterized protein N7483_000604 [Penicillium malachiteum]KAJ5735479.1 hypothetical protein N7483_000604 [Penicillium malachiteum]
MSDTKDATADTRRLILISVPRTASNLLLKILIISKQPNLLSSPKEGYFFYSAFLESTVASGDATRSADQWTEEQKHHIRNSYQKCIESLEEYSSRAIENNKRMFTKEHSSWLFSPATIQKRVTGIHNDEFFKAFRVDTPEKYGPTKTYSPSNETIFSDEYLRSWQMAFIIRHPALAWPSVYRSLMKMSEFGIMAQDSVIGTSFTHMDMRWTRLLYDWCLEQPDTPAPPLLDAHDLIHNPEIVLEFCERTGLDKNALQFEWPDKNEAKKSLIWACHNPEAGDVKVKMHQNAAGVLLVTLEASTGIVNSKTPETIDVAAELESWREELGVEVATLIENAVRKSMPDYEYLMTRRLMVKLV